jgi:hypothetical protein
MKSIFTKITLVLLAGTTLFSCSVEKRYHSGGWNIGLRKGGTNESKKESSRYAAVKSAKATQTPQAQSAESSIVTAKENFTVNNAAASIAAQEDLKINRQEKAEEVATQNSEISEKFNVVKTSKVFAEKQMNKVTSAKNEKQEGSKSWLVTVLLCFFLGAIGIHRFYLGYTTIGIIQLLTLGGLGLWTLIDFIRILIRDLQPKDGSYED